jgi:YVTN family beta-propeller protein
VEFAILGPLEARDDGRRLKLGGPKQRAVLAMLLLDANRPISRDRLIDGLWGEAPPPSAAHTLDDYVSRLRRAVGGERIERRPAGYLIRVEPGELDLERFEALLEQGRSAAAAGDAARASAVLGQALGLWRGRALADLENEPFAASESERLEERRLLAVEVRIDAELALGRGGELVGELEQLVAEHPFRERLLGQVMLALYRAGRRADALAAYQACRRRFAQELGLEPSSELRALERQILEQDAALGAAIPSPSAAPARRVRRGRIAAIGVALVAVAASAIAGVELGTGGSSASALGRSRTGVVEIRSNAPVAGASLNDAPAAMAADAHSIWLAEPDAGAVVQIDETTRQRIETIAVGGSPAVLAVGGGSIWVASVPGETIERIDPTIDKVTQRIHVRNGGVSALAYGLGRLWAADATNQQLLAFDPATGKRTQTIQVDVRPSALAAGLGAIWVAGYDAGLVEAVDPRSGSPLGTARVGSGPAAVATGDGAVWVANSLDNTVSRVDPASDTSPAAIPVGNTPIALTVSGKSVLVGNEYSSSVSRIDSRRDLVVHTTRVGGGPTAVVSASGGVWVGTRNLYAHRGGTLVLLHTNPLSLDPALQVDLPPVQSNGLTYDALLTSPHTGGPRALSLIPDLAVSVPVPTDGGTAYTFRLRHGIRYSDGRLVRASDFRRAVERLLRLHGPWSGNYIDIVGATACTAQRCNLSHGIVTDDAAGTITFHLSAPNPYFLSTMTAIATAPVPPGTPFHDVGAHPIPATGPYMVASANQHEIRYLRNPHFREWSHAAQPDGNPDQIIMRYGLTAAQEVRAVERRQADWTPDGIPAALQQEVTTRFPSLLHRLLASQLDAFLLNTRRPPFDNLDARKALNLAIDRAAIVRMFGGPTWATPTCQLLPPGMLGYRPHCPYTLDPRTGGRWTAPDLPLARRLVAASGTRGEHVTVWAGTDGGILATAVVPYIVRVLRQLGYRARARIAPPSYFHKHPQVFEHIQLIPIAQANGPPLGFLYTFACTADPTHPWFCDPRLDPLMHEAAMLQATNPTAAGLLIARIDHELVDSAAAVPLVNPYWFDFVSAHVHNYQADPILGLIADQVSLR